MNESLSSMIVPGVLWALVVFSVLSWGLLLIKSAQYLKLKTQNKQFTKAFWTAPDLLTAAEHATQYPGSLARIANSGFEAMAVDESPRTTQQLAHTINRSDRLERNLRQQIQKERRSLEAGQAILASIAPFIGLFGTVWGIMEALQSIGASGSASLETVAGPIGHALIATGVGIAVAVPAVLIYNFFLRRLKLAVADMDDFAHDFDSLAQRSAFAVSRQPIAHKHGQSVREAS
jgi:biopolymer transport protein ExbB